MNLREYFDDTDSRVERCFEESGLECCTVTRPMGHRCGYVAVREGHPLFGVFYDDVYKSEPDIEVDGGLTYSRGKEGIWVFGWDAAHAWHLNDTSIMDESYRMVHERYGDLHFGDSYMVDADMAEEETRSLARQIAEAAE